MNKKIIGWTIIILAFLFIDIVPGPTDIIPLQIYSSVTGADISPANLSVIYLDYFIWSMVVGIILLFIGMNLLEWDLRRLMRKLDIGKYKIALAIGVLVTILIAYLDIQGLVFFTDLGRDYTIGEFPKSYWYAFRNTAYILMALVALCYYNFARRDISEAIAVFITPFILFWFGFSDLLYFILQRQPFPETLPWLVNHPVIGRIANFLNFDGVTNVALIVSVLIGVGVVIIGTKILKENF